MLCLVVSSTVMVYIGQPVILPCCAWWYLVLSWFVLVSLSFCHVVLGGIYYCKNFYGPTHHFCRDIVCEDT